MKAVLQKHFHSSPHTSLEVRGQSWSNISCPRDLLSPSVFLFLAVNENKQIISHKKCEVVPLCFSSLWVAILGDSMFFCFVFSGAFFLYSSMALLGFVFTYGCLPETKSRRLEEIEALFENHLCSCGASDSDEGRQVEYIRVKGSNYHLSDNDASDVD